MGILFTLIAWVIQAAVFIIGGLFVVGIGCIIVAILKHLWSAAFTSKS